MKKAAAGSAPKSAAAAAAGSDTAFVYLCCKCAHIIGDSESLVHAEDVDDAITLRCKLLDIIGTQSRRCCSNALMSAIYAILTTCSPLQIRLHTDISGCPLLHFRRCNQRGACWATSAVHRKQ
jgi:hypothetical protein